MGGGSDPMTTGAVAGASPIESAKVVAHFGLNQLQMNPKSIKDNKRRTDWVLMMSNNQSLPFLPSSTLALSLFALRRLAQWLIGQ